MKKWTYKVDNKMRGAYGDTDYKTKTIRINKKKHRKEDKTLKRITPNKDGSEKIGISIQHELVHKTHPKLNEKKTEKLAEAMWKHMNPKQKAKLYAKFN